MSCSIFTICSKYKMETLFGLVGLWGMLSMVSGVGKGFHQGDNVMGCSSGQHSCVRGLH